MDIEKQEKIINKAFNRENQNKKKTYYFITTAPLYNRVDPFYGLYGIKKEDYFLHVVEVEKDFHKEMMQRNLNL